MIDPTESVAGRADELRRLFDASFAMAPDASAAKLVDLLAIRVGDAPYAVRLGEISGISPDAAPEPIPSQHPQLLGIAAFRGVFLPVFDLRLVLGQKLGAPPRWTLLVGAPARVGLAFDQFDGHLRVANEAIASTKGPSAASAYTSEIVETDTGILPVIHLPSVLASVERDAQPTMKEH